MSPTVRVRQSKSSATLASVQLGPSASHFDRISARRRLDDEARALAITSRQSLRSSSERRTIYFFNMAILLDRLAVSPDHAEMRTRNFRSDGALGEITTIRMGC